LILAWSSSRSVWNPANGDLRAARGAPARFRNRGAARALVGRDRLLLPHALEHLEERDHLVPVLHRKGLRAVAPIHETFLGNADLALLDDLLRHLTLGAPRLGVLDAERDTTVVGHRVGVEARARPRRRVLARAHREPL